MSTGLIVFLIIVAVLIAIVVYFVNMGGRFMNGELSPKEIEMMLARIKANYPEISDEDALRFVDPKSRSDCEVQANVAHLISPLTAAQRADLVATCQKRMTS